MSPRDTDRAAALLNELAAAVAELRALVGDTPTADAPPPAAPAGVSLADAACWLPRPVGMTPASVVRRWAKGRHRTPPEIGPDPWDGRRRLVRLADLVRFVSAVEALDLDEAADLRAFLRARLREPRRESWPGSFGDRDSV